MPKPLFRVLQLLCAASATWVGAQALSLSQKDSALPDIELDSLKEWVASNDDPVSTADNSETKEASKAASTDTAKTDPKEKATKKNATPFAALPEHYKVIHAKGILGKAPPARVVPPVLQGIAGDYALIKAPSGASGMAREGESVGKVKVLKIGTNRVLIEYQEKTQELTIHWGVGGSTLIPPPTPDSVDPLSHSDASKNPTTTPVTKPKDENKR